MFSKRSILLEMQGAIAIFERERMLPKLFCPEFVYAVTEEFLHQSQLIQVETTVLKDVSEGRSTLKNSMFFKQCSICLDPDSLKP